MTAPSYVGESVRTVKSTVGNATRMAASFVGLGTREAVSAVGEATRSFVSRVSPENRFPGEPIWEGEYGFTNVLDAGEAVASVASAEVRYRNPNGTASDAAVTGHDGSTRFWSHSVADGTFDTSGTWQAQLVLTLSSGVEIVRRSRIEVRPILTPFLPTGLLGLSDGSVLGLSETDAVGVES